jgi:hypothetical protein
MKAFIDTIERGDQSVLFGLFCVYSEGCIESQEFITKYVAVMNIHLSFWHFRTFAFHLFWMRTTLVSEPKCSTFVTVTSKA